MDICYECQDLMVKKQGPITITKTGYGPYEVPGVIHYACDKCGIKVILPEETERVEIEGLKLHIIKVLSETDVMTALELKEAVRGTVDNLETAVMALVKENKIDIDYLNPEEPKLSLGSGVVKKKTLWDKLKKWAGGGK